MKIKNNTFSMTIGVLLLGMHSLANAAAKDDRVSVHGYGDTGFIRAIDNNYTQKPGGNNWDFNYLSVNFTAQIDEKTKIVAQIRQGSEITGDMGAYVHHNLTDNLTARAGQMKAPVGIFNEIRDIKFLQLSALTPLMYQDAVGILPDSFKGVEAIYHLDMGTHRLSFNVYGGEPKGANNYVEIQPLAAPGYYVLVQNIYGGRLTYKTPVGLKFSLSSFQNDLLSNTCTLPCTPGTPPAATAPNATSSIRRLSSASIDFRNYNFDIKMEIAMATDFPGTASENTGKSYYGQIGYTFAEKITPYIRYDYLIYNIQQDANPGAYQVAKVAGFSYKLNNNVSMRMENHWNHGYAIPANTQGINFNYTDAKLDWNLFAMGINFIF
jgi:hypothetical protein